MEEAVAELRVTLVQADLVWQNIDANLTLFDRAIEGLSGQTDLVILPEMFATGFCLKAELLAQTMDGAVVQWMLSTSRKLRTDMVGSVIIEENGNYFNRLVWACPSGQIHWYDKKHLFRYAGENEVFTSGDATIVVDLKGWKIKPFICYDLRFPIWARNKNNEYDLSLYVANWPAKRAYHWQALLAARAIENQSYVIGVNRVGTDGNGRDYSGGSTVYDPEGGVLYSKKNVADTSTVLLSYSALTAYRKQFPAWMDADTQL